MEQPFSVLVAGRRCVPKRMNLPGESEELSPVWLRQVHDRGLRKSSVLPFELVKLSDGLLKATLKVCFHKVVLGVDREIPSASVNHRVFGFSELSFPAAVGRLLFVLLRPKDGAQIV